MLHILEPSVLCFRTSPPPLCSSNLVNLAKQGVGSSSIDFANLWGVTVGDFDALMHVLASLNLPGYLCLSPMPLVVAQSQELANGGILCSRVQLWNCPVTPPPPGRWKDE